MTVDAIRAAVKRYAPTLNSIRAGGFGFSWCGWEYVYGPRGWRATNGQLVGVASTPLAAKDKALAK